MIVLQFLSLNRLVDFFFCFAYMYLSFNYRFLINLLVKIILQFHSRTKSIKVVVLGIHRVNDLKTGTLVGVDKYGNKYYEDKRNFFGTCGNVNTS